MATVRRFMIAEPNHARGPSQTSRRRGDRRRAEQISDGRIHDEPSGARRPSSSCALGHSSSSGQESTTVFSPPETPSFEPLPAAPLASAGALWQRCPCGVSQKIARSRGCQPCVGMISGNYGDPADAPAVEGAAGVPGTSAAALLSKQLATASPTRSIGIRCRQTRVFIAPHRLAFGGRHPRADVGRQHDYYLDSWVLSAARSVSARARMSSAHRGQ